MGPERKAKMFLLLNVNIACLYLAAGASDAMIKRLNAMVRCHAVSALREDRPVGSRTGGKGPQ